MHTNTATVSIIALVLAAVVLIGVAISSYNTRTNRIYADLLKNSSDPLAVRCAWYGDSQVCLLSGRK